MGGYPLGIVISPRREGVKALCVRLTASGKIYLNSLRDQAMQSKKDIRDYIFYYQVLFEISDESCTVIDFREKEEVISTLTRFIASGQTDTCGIN